MPLIYFAPLFFLIMWSVGPIFIKMGLPYTSVWSLLTIRAVGSLMIMTLLCFFIFKKTIPKIKALSFKQWLSLFIASMLLQVGYQSFCFLSLDCGLSAGLFTLIMGLQPLLTAAFARENIGWKGYSILSMGLLGLALAITGAKNFDQISSIGISFAFASLLSITVGTIYHKTLSISPVVSNSVQLLSSSAVFLVITWFVGWYVEYNLTVFLTSAWLILGVSIGAFMTLLWMLEQHQASRVSVLFYLVPIVTMSLEFFLFDIRLSPITLLGSTIVIASIFLYQRHYKTC